jgi:hypothetical protein
VTDLLGGAPPANEIEAIAQRLSDPGPWLGLVHRDGCPDNVLLSDGRAHLIDFEFAGPGHVMLDATYWRLGFPTCWCAGRIPDDVISRMDRAYRDALPIEVDDGAFRQETAMLLFVRMFASQAWLLEGALRGASRPTAHACSGTSRLPSPAPQAFRSSPGCAPRRCGGATTSAGADPTRSPSRSIRPSGSRQRHSSHALPDRELPARGPEEHDALAAYDVAATSPTTRTLTRTELPGR